MEVPGGASEASTRKEEAVRENRKKEVVERSDRKRRRSRAKRLKEKEVASEATSSKKEVVGAPFAQEKEVVGAFARWGRVSDAPAAALVCALASLARCSLVVLDVLVDPLRLAGVEGRPVPVVREAREVVLNARVRVPEREKAGRVRLGWRQAGSSSKHRYGGLLCPRFALAPLRALSPRTPWPREP